MKVRKAFVDARYLEPTIPKTTPPPFEVEPGVRWVPVGELPQLAEQADSYVIVGAGKTAIDACLWLLENGVAPDAITWVKPREAWLLNRYFAQSGSLVGQLMEGISLQAEAAAVPTSPDELFGQLADREQLLRVDKQVTPTMFRAPTMSVAELSLLRHVTHVVRLGRIRRIERGKIVQEHGTVPTSPGALHVHCAASGTSLAPAVTIFEPGRITLQCMRTGLQPFNAALTGYVEVTRDDIAEKNRLCPPNRQPNTPADWIHGTLIQWAADREWSRQDDLGRMVGPLASQRVARPLHSLGRAARPGGGGALRLARATGDDQPACVVLTSGALSCLQQFGVLLYMQESRAVGGEQLGHGRVELLRLVAAGVINGAL